MAKCCDQELIVTSNLEWRGYHLICSLHVYKIYEKVQITTFKYNESQITL
jgi:hypothetical protein